MVIQEAPEFLSSQICTKYKATYELIPSEKIQTSWVTPPHGATEKMHELKWVKKAEAHSCHNSSLNTAPYNWEKTLDSQLLSEDRKVCTTHIVP